MNAHAAILEALIRRGKAGQGAAIAVSLFDGIAEWMTVPLLHADYGGVAPARVGIAHASIAPYGLFTAGDGSEFVIAVQNEREWRHFCHDVLQRADMADDPRFASNPSRCSNRPALAASIAKALVQLDGATLAARLVGARIAFGRLNDVAGLSVHPQLRRIEVQAPRGAVSMPAPPAIIDGEPPRAFGPVPCLGADTARLRAEFTGSPVSPDPDHEAMT
jgi:crotonobetainyl-CoA:carnitine CoA-transferase CaiB-like acyl-CoA transferase